MPTKTQAKQKSNGRRVETYDAAISGLPDFRKHTKSLIGKYWQRINLLTWQPDLVTIQQTKNQALWKKGRKLWDEVGLDDMVKSGTSAWVSSIAPDARVIPSGDTVEHKWVADGFEEMFKGIKGGLLLKIGDVLRGAGHGFSVSEVDYNVLIEGEYRGWFGITGIRKLLPHYLQPEFDEEGDGSLIRIWQVDPYSGEMNPVALDKVIHYIHEEPEDPFSGQSLWTPAHIHWQAKQILIQLRNYNAEWVVGRLTVKHEDTENAVSPKEFSTRAETLIQNYLKFMGFKLWRGMSAQLIQSSISPDVFNPVIRDCNQGILRTIGPPWLTMEEGQFGTRAQAQVHSSTHEQRIKPLRQHVEALIGEDWGSPIKQVCRLNGWSIRHCPLFSLLPAVEEDKRQSVTLYNQSVSSGTLQPVPADQNVLRERITFPMVKEVRTQEPDKQEVFHFADQWWKRPLSPGEKLVAFADINTGLDNIISDAKSKMDGAWRSSLRPLKTKIFKWVQSPNITPKKLLENIANVKMDLSEFESIYVEHGHKAYEFGRKHALDELSQAGVAVRFDVSPRDPYKLGNFMSLLLARSFEMAKGRERKALNSISSALANMFAAGVSNDDSIERLNEIFNGLAAGNLISPGTPGADFSKPSVQETTVRTMYSSAFNSARNEVYQRHKSFVKGVEISEVANGRDGQRSHPLSKILDGLKIRLSDPRYRILTPPNHFNDRAVAVPVLATDGDVQWSTDSEVNNAISSGRRLSPRFF